MKETKEIKKTKKEQNGISITIQLSDGTALTYGTAFHTMKGIDELVKIVKTDIKNKTLIQ